jgi:hypothetical protein
VDPTLTGKVKITVIATGFGQQPSAKRASGVTEGQTPVDMTLYVDHAQARADSGPAVASPRLSIARRQVLDLPLTASSGSASLAASQAISAGKATGTTDDVKKVDLDADLDFGSAFDVPAFLRRQEN